MPSIEINRERIIVGAATRLELDGYDLGPTVGEVVVRRETELIDILTDLGTVIDKFQNRIQVFVELELAAATVHNLAIAWGGRAIETVQADGSVSAVKLALDPVYARESARQLIIEGPGAGDLMRRYTLPNVVSLAQTSQSIRKGSILSVPIEFEVLMDPQASDEQYGRVEELPTTS